MKGSENTPNINALLWFIKSGLKPNKIIRLDIQVPPMKEEVRRYRSNTNND